MSNIPEGLRLLFIPASGPKGTGEYFRSVTIANYLADTLVTPEIHFVLNEKSAAAASCNYSVSLIPDSPTYCIEQVASIMQAFQPDIVFFDATGRTAQIKQAKELGAKTIFIAQNRKLLRRGLRWKRMPYTDEVWIAQPEFLLPLTWYSGWKSRHKNVPVRYIGAVMPPMDATAVTGAVDALDINEEFVLVNPGGGGHHKSGIPVASVFEAAAVSVRKLLDKRVVLVYGPNYTGELLHKKGITAIPSLPPDVFNAVLARAAGFISGGGGAVFQAAANNVPTVAVPISPDQTFRLKGMKKLQLIAVGNLDADKLAEKLKGQMSSHTRQSVDVRFNQEVIIQSIKKLYRNCSDEI